MIHTKVVLCVDSESIKNPCLIGLEGENFESQKWLRVFCSAMEARTYLRQSSESHEVWVASSDDIDAINLAAALKKDSKMKQVYLFAIQGSGSLKSRANAAGIDRTFSQQDFLNRYAQFKLMGVTSGLSPEGFVHEEKKIPLLDEAGPMTPSFTLEKTTSHAKGAHILSVVSASGGSGKSTISALSALISQELGFKTLLFDGDMQFGDMQYFLADEKPLTIDKVLAEQHLISQLKPKGSRPALLAAPAHLEQSETLSSGIPHLLDILKPSFDVIVVNTGAFWMDQHVSLLERSSTGLFLVDQHASSIRACKHALDLCVRCGIAISPFLFAINRCARNAPFTSIDVSCALQGVHVVELQDGGREVSDLLSAGLPSELIETRNELSQSIEKMLLDILPETEETTRRSRSWEKGKRFRLSRRKRRSACP